MLKHVLQKKFKDIFQQILPLSCPVCGRYHHLRTLCWSCKPGALVDPSKRCIHCYTKSDHTQKLSSASNICYLCSLGQQNIRYSRYAWELSPEIHQLISCMKYKPSKKIALELSQNACGALQYFPINDWDLIVPIPSSHPTFKKRLFNQALILGLQAQRILPKTTLAPQALRHIGYKRTQASLKHKARWANVKHAFQANSQIVQNKKILLLDDIVTTGATSFFAAQELLRAGAEVVDLFSLARSAAFGEWRDKRKKVN